MVCADIYWGRGLRDLLLEPMPSALPGLQMGTPAFSCSRGSQGSRVSKAV